MEAQRYTAIAIVLHWAIAFAILFNLPLGFWMHGRAEHGEITDGVFRAFQLHKSIGLTVLTVSLVRLGWRLANPPPPLPPHMPAWERFAANATHWAFYALMIGLPFSGWVYVSTGWSAPLEQPLPSPTEYFGMFNVPHLFGLREAATGTRIAVGDGSFVAHYVLAYAAIALAVLHVFAALKHQFFDRDEVMAHMVPGLRAPKETTPPPGNPVRRAILGFGFALIVMTGVAWGYAVATLDARGESAAMGSNFEMPASAPETTAPEPAPTPTPADPNQRAPITAPARWQIDSGQSSIGFGFVYSEEGEREGTRFEGRFTRWRADIRFDAANLNQSAATVTIEVASATDGVPIHDQYLPSAEWFDAANHPSAVFRSRSIRALDGNRYEARGDLTIKGRTRPATLPFALAIADGRASMNGRLTIDRRDFDVGKDSEGDDYISRDVDVSVRVEAVRAP